MSKYLDDNGLIYFWSKIKTWVNSVLPTKTSQLNNDSGFITSSDIPEGAAASTTTPKMDGTAAVGTEMAFARGDHRHPTDTSRQAVISDLATIRSGASAGATAYQKPSGGIPKTDLATAVQTSLGKADSALQSYTETDPVFSASPAAGITAENITAWSSGEENVVKSVNTTAGTSGVNLSLSSAGALDVTISSGSVASGNSNFVTGGTVHTAISSLAPKASPALSGTPTAPTAAAGTNTTQIATTAFVTSAIATASAGLASFQGTVNTASTITGASYKKGWYWVVGTAGTYVGETCEAGDMIFAQEDKGSSYSASDFNVVQTNMDVRAITNAEIDTITA